MEPGVPEAAVQTVSSQNPLLRDVTCPLSPEGSSARGGSFPCPYPSVFSVEPRAAGAGCLLHQAFCPSLRQLEPGPGALGPTELQHVVLLLLSSGRALPHPYGKGSGDCPQEMTDAANSPEPGLPAVLHLPERVTPSSIPAPLGSRGCRAPRNRRCTPRTSPWADTRLSVHPLRRGQALLAWSHCLRQGEALRSFTLFCPEVIFQSPRPCHLLKVQVCAGKPGCCDKRPGALQSTGFGTPPPGRPCSWSEWRASSGCWSQRAISPHHWGS